MYQGGYQQGTHDHTGMDHVGRTHNRGFAVIEGYALSGRAPEGATLSAHLRRALGIHPAKPWHRVSRYALVGALSAVAVHLIIVEVESVGSSQDLLSWSSMVERAS